MSKQKVLSIRVEEKLCTKLAEQAKRSGYKTVLEIRVTCSKKTGIH